MYFFKFYEIKIYFTENDFIFSQKVPPVIVISLDGFRAEYLMRNMTPNLAKIMSCGASTSYMRAMFPTKTFPNHYTLATVRAAYSFCGS